MILETSLCSTGSSLYTSGYIKQLSLFSIQQLRGIVCELAVLVTIYGERIQFKILCSIMMTLVHCISSLKYFSVKNSNIKRSTVDKKIFDFICFSFVLPLLRWLIMFPIWLGHVQNEKQIGYSLYTPLKSPATRE